jgi:hypothetical protein
MQRRRVVVAGSVAQRPFVGGHTWVFLHYLLGFRQLGWDVHFIDRLDRGMCVDGRGEPVEFAASANLSYLADVMSRFDLGDCWTLGHDGWREVAGIGRTEAVQRIRQSDLLLNVMGYMDDPEMLAAAQCATFVDIDPGFGQMWRELGLHDLFSGHDRFVTVGQNVGRADCAVPTCGIEWISTKPPVVLGLWDDASPPGRSYSSVVTWRGPFGPIDYRGVRYGLRAHEMRRFVDLPARTGASFELALSIDDGDDADRSRLLASGWKLVDPRGVASDPWSYRSYVERSRGELMVAKHMYVASNSGWFSDRSACYLAAGRPVVAQNTGLEDHLPLGRGLLGFNEIDDAADAIRRVDAEWGVHARAARELAREHFAADVVLPSLIDRLGVG